jgi:hypothetical protein
MVKEPEKTPRPAPSPNATGDFTTTEPPWIRQSDPAGITSELYFPAGMVPGELSVPEQV